jgi:multiple sugar transport system permease protein
MTARRPNLCRLKLLCQACAPAASLAWTLLLIGGVLMMTPLLFMFSTSLKDAGQVYDLSWSRFPADARQLRQGAVRRALRALVRNSTGIATVVTLSNVFFDSLVGYTLAKFKFRGRYSSSSRSCRR